jgi:DsbC/DsbD-like thiol-disulfide interchange protein
MTHSRVRLFLVAFATIAAILPIPPSYAAARDGFASPWSKALNSAMRLVSAGGSPEVLRAAIEIHLDPHAITYWRNPGEAGAPPIFSFSGSQNVADTRVSFPAPTRFNEGGMAAFGYQSEVVFPVYVTAVDPLKPVIVNATVDYAVCAAVCVPAKGTARLQLTTEPGPFAALVATAEQRIPVPLTRPQTLRMTPESGGKSWIVSPTALPDASDAELFVEAPDGWYFESQRLADNSGFRLTLAEKPPTGALPLDGVRLTLVSTSAAYEAMVRLDVAPVSP